MNLRKKEERGITLVALVVTIIVLIILAVISINAVFGEDGIVNRAEGASDRHGEGEQEDLNAIGYFDELIANKIGSGEGTGNTAIVEPENIEDWEYTVEEDGTITLTMYKGTDTEVVIPNHINGIPVRTIGSNLKGYEGDEWDSISVSSLWSIEMCEEGMFYGYYFQIAQKTITKVVISEGIEVINDSFCGSEALQNVILPSTLIKIGAYAFYGCTSLASIDIPDNVTSIGNEVFYGCTSLASIDIPDNVTSIGYYAFGECTSLASIDISDNVTSIGDEVFYGCTSLASIDIPDNVTSIGYRAFCECTSLASIDIPNNVTSIGYRAFKNCTSLASIDIPDNVTSIGDEVFYGCTSLASIDIPDNVTSIGYRAFYECTSLASVTIDSETIVGQIASSTSAQYLVNYATTIYIKETIQESSIGSYITNTSYFTKVETDKTGYYKYTKN